MHWTPGDNDIEALAEIAKSDPQIAYSAYVFGTSKRWQFVCRTTPGISDSMQKLEDKIRSVLIPAIVGKDYVPDELRMVYSVPARMGGLGICNPAEDAEFEYSNSCIATRQPAEAI